MDGAVSGTNMFCSIVEQLVRFHQLFNFWVSLAEGLWENRDELIPSGAAQEGASKYTTALAHIIDSLIAAAVREYNLGSTGGSHYSAHIYTEPQDLARTLQLLDLMALTCRTHHSGRLITSVSQRQGIC